MTDTPKVRFSNSILDDVKDKEEKADKAKNAAVKADVNAGAPSEDAPPSEARAKFTREQAKKEMEKELGPEPAKV